MSHVPKLLNALALLLDYPNDSTVQTVELLYVVLHCELDAAAQDAALFGAFLEQHDLSEIEEAFTQTFDINPLSALEVGWHLFGEEYARGMFLVRMREELRKYGLAESAELPDHLSHVLAIVSVMPEAEATRFVRACVQPAVEKMNEALSTRDTPYRHVMSCLANVLKYIWGEPSSANPGEHLAGVRPRPFEGDLLHAFPVADVTCGCDTGCDGSAQFVPVQIDLPLSAGKTSEATLISARKP